MFSNKTKLICNTIPLALRVASLPWLNNESGHSIYSTSSGIPYHPQVKSGEILGGFRPGRNVKSPSHLDHSLGHSEVKKDSFQTRGS